MSPTKRQPTKSCLTRTLATPSRRSRAFASPSKKRSIGFCPVARVRAIPIEGHGKKVLKGPRLFSPLKQSLDEAEQVRLARERTGSKEMEYRKKLYRKWRKTADARAAIAAGESRERLTQRFSAFIVKHEREVTELKKRMRLNDEESLQILMLADARRRDGARKKNTITRAGGIELDAKNDHHRASNIHAMLTNTMFIIASTYLQSKLQEWDVPPFWQALHALFMFCIIGLAVATVLKK